MRVKRIPSISSVQADGKEFNFDDLLAPLIQDATGRVFIVVFGTEDPSTNESWYSNLKKVLIYYLTCIIRLGARIVGFRILLLENTSIKWTILL